MLRWSPHTTCCLSPCHGVIDHSFVPNQEGRGEEAWAWREGGRDCETVLKGPEQEEFVFHTTRGALDGLGEPHCEEWPRGESLQPQTSLSLFEPVVLWPLASPSPSRALMTGICIIWGKRDNLGVGVSLSSLCPFPSLSGGGRKSRKRRSSK